MNGLKTYRKIGLLLCFIVYTQSNSLFAQAYKINLTIKGADGLKLQFGYYQGDNQYVIQTSGFSKNGKISLEGKEDLQTGIYFVAIENGVFLDLLIKNERNFAISAQKDDLINTLKAENSKENQIFFNYQKQVYHLKTRLAEIDSLIQKTTAYENSIESLNQQKSEINAQLGQLVSEYSERYKESYLAKILVAVEASNPDEIDYSDPDLLRTPFYHNMIRLFIKKNINAGSSFIISETVKFLEQIKVTEANFRYAAGYLLNFYNTFYRNGINEVFVSIADHYFLNGKASWLTVEALQQLRERRDFLARGLPGMPAADLTLESISGEYYSLHQLESKMTLLYFWSVNCGHCAASTKAMADHYPVLQKRDIKIFAVNMDKDKEQWLKKVEENGLPWINCYDPMETSDYRNKYYVYGSPLLFVIGQNKKILAVKNGENEIVEFVNQLVGN